MMTKRPYHRLRLWLIPALFVVVAALHITFLGFTELERLAKMVAGFTIAWWIVNYEWIRYGR